MAAPDGGEGYQALPSADYGEEAGVRAVRRSSSGAKATAKLWLFADALACAMLLTAVVLFYIVRARGEGLAVAILVVAAAAAAVHIGARCCRGRPSALHASAIAFILASPMNVLLAFGLTCCLLQEGSAGTKDSELATAMAFVYLILALLSMVGGVKVVMELTRIQGSCLEPGMCALAVAAARVQQDPEAVRKAAEQYKQEREAASRRQLARQVRQQLEAAELQALKTFEAAKMEAPDGTPGCRWKAPEAEKQDSAWESWRAAADKLQLFQTDPDAYLKRYKYYC
ncbi:hypothetical protein ABPG75_011043 [Micractinium tetrahymenae]